MMNLKSIILLVFMALSLSIISSCGGDDDDGGSNTQIDCTNIETYYEDLYDDLITALNNFSNDPNATTCNAYVDAVESYIEDVLEVLECDNISNVAAIETSLEQYQEALDQLRTDCNSL